MVSWNLSQITVIIPICFQITFIWSGVRGANAIASCLSTCEVNGNKAWYQHSFQIKTKEDFATETINVIWQTALFLLNSKMSLRTSFFSLLLCLQFTSNYQSTVRNWCKWNRWKFLIFVVAVAERPNIRIFFGLHKMKITISEY